MKYLVIIDMQYDFVYGCLGTPEARKIIPVIRKRIDEFRKSQECGRILFTQDTHGDNYLNTQEGKQLPVVHCIKNTEGWKILEELYMPGAQIIEKETFGSLQLANLIARDPQVDSIELMGVCTDICVVSNALLLKAHFPEVPIRVYAEGCAGVTPSSHEMALNTMRMCQIEII